MGTKDSERLLKEIETKLRIGKLDSGLLFLCSSLSFLFGLLQTLLAGVQTITYFLPLLVFGWILPFYLGYVKGALLDNSVIERSIGWIYLIFGNLMYLANLISHLIPRLFPEQPIIGILAAFSPFIAGFLFGRWLTKFVGKIFEICDKKLSEIELKITDSIAQSAIYFSVAGSFYVLNLPNIVSADFGLTAVILVFIFAGAMFYSAGSSYVKKIGRPYRVLEKAGKPKIARFGRCLSIFSLICMVIIANTPNGRHFQTFISVLLPFIVGFIFYTIFSAKTEIIFEKYGDTMEQNEEPF